MTDLANPIRSWRKAQGLSLVEASARFFERGVSISTATLSRIERDQQVPVEQLVGVSAVTGIPARQLRPDLAELFSEVGR